MSYDLIKPNSPRLAGAKLRLLVSLLESPRISRYLHRPLFGTLGISRLRRMQLDEPPTEMPLVGRSSTDPIRLAESGSTAPAFPQPCVADYHKAYQDGSTDPEAVASRVVGAIRRSNAGDPPLRAIISCDESDVLTQARASAARWKEGRPLSELDGVPIAVKDELDQVPYPTSVGTAFLRQKPERDSTVVERLRAAGALLIGKTNMHEIGLGVTGLNPHHGTVRNPFDPTRHTGGSSSGSAAAVAAGLCPVAIGAEGGGSIRIPSGLCGVVGLKPTFGRVSEAGAFPLCPSLGHVGPIGNSTADVACAYEIIAGPDPRDPMTADQPAPVTPGGPPPDLEGLRVGIYEPWFNDAEPEVVAIVRQTVETFKVHGARVVPVELPGLDDMRVAQLILIVTEMLDCMSRFLPEHRKELGLDVRMNFALAAFLGDADRRIANQVRTRAIRDFTRAFEQADIIVTPTTGRTAPPIRTDAADGGESDLMTLSELMRFVACGNLTGLPAISLPVGHDSGGLPIGMQAIAPWWREDLLLSLSYFTENLWDRRLPPIYFPMPETGL